MDAISSVCLALSSSDAFAASAAATSAAAASSARVFDTAAAIKARKHYSTWDWTDRFIISCAESDEPQRVVSAAAHCQLKKRVEELEAVLEQIRKAANV